MFGDKVILLSWDPHMRQLEFLVDDDSKNTPQNLFNKKNAYIFKRNSERQKI